MFCTETVKLMSHLCLTFLLMLYSGLSFAAFTLTPLKPTKINEKPAIGLLTIQFFSDQNMQEETYSLGDCADCAREMQQNEVA